MYLFNILLDFIKGIPGKKEGEDVNLDGKGIAARILGPSKPVCCPYIWFEDALFMFLLLLLLYI